MEQFFYGHKINKFLWRLGNRILPWQIQINECFIFRYAYPFCKVSLTLFCLEQSINSLFLGSIRMMYHII